ncbi:hypothetical protein BC936DRAFT_144722 [Jimgerdemannia flammicorona]|uniref:F-box domain-containing protein n=1 Tax=Jimgerdemannia flammicorona TaxID=994334 RepID=A0A433DM38_9FUNG|nr:hypothetical protein BC936DRAFT_144722 [Jimgerdemannia flammicorona]
MILDLSGASMMGTLTSVPKTHYVMQKRRPSTVYPDSTPAMSTSHYFIPTELLVDIISHVTALEDLQSLLLVNRTCYRIVSQRCYTKVIFPDHAITPEDVLAFCAKYGRSLKTIKLPHTSSPLFHWSNRFFLDLLRLCPNVAFLQTMTDLSETQVKILLDNTRDATFLLTQTDAAQQAALGRAGTKYPRPASLPRMDCFREGKYVDCPLPCCGSLLTFPNDTDEQLNFLPFVRGGRKRTPDNTVVTHVTGYAHHPLALQNVILPNYGAELVVLYLNPYDILDAALAKLIAKQCPRIRAIFASEVKVEGLWMLLRACDSLVMVGCSAEGKGVEGVVRSVEKHKRVSCVHTEEPSKSNQHRRFWHVGVTPRK